MRSSELSEIFCDIDEVVEVWVDKGNVREDPYVEDIEIGGPDSDYEILQVLGIASELKSCERREPRR
jgi:hypothetical protein